MCTKPVIQCFFKTCWVKYLCEIRLKVYQCDYLSVTNVKVKTMQADWANRGSPFWFNLIIIIHEVVIKRHP